jgi:sigma-E factor negative regulatory protein RseC
MEIEATVSRVEGAHAFVRVDNPTGGCGRCNDTGGCASGLLGRPLARECRLFRLPNSIGAQPGERVLVSIADGAALRAAILVYLLPVLLLVAGSVSGAAIAGQQGADMAAYAGGGIGVGIAVALGIFHGVGRRGSRFQPVLRRRTRPAVQHARVEGT